MKKVIVIIMLFTIMTGCGKTARLMKIEREVAEEQTSLAAEAKANRSYFQIVKDTFYKHSYMYSALILTAAIGTASYLRYYHKPKHNFNKHMLALEYHPTPTDFIIPKQVVDFLNQQPVNNPRQLLNHPGQPNNSVFSEPFIQYYEKTFKQKPILMLTYDPKQVPHQETPAWKARDPLLDEALFAIYGDKRGRFSRYDMDVEFAVFVYSWVWKNADRPGAEFRFVPWLDYTQAVWEEAIKRYDQIRPHDKPLPPRPVSPADQANK